LRTADWSDPQFVEGLRADARQRHREELDDTVSTYRSVLRRRAADAGHDELWVERELEAYRAEVEAADLIARPADPLELHPIYRARRKMLHEQVEAATFLADRRTIVEEAAEAQAWLDHFMARKHAEAAA
jgi:hypothetical protein